MLFADLIAHLIDLVGINQVDYLDGRLLKTRQWGRGALIRVGNIFLKLSNSHIVMFPSCQHWQEWEYECYQRLYGGGCEIIGQHAILIDPFAGYSIRQLLKTGDITPLIMKGVAEEFKRVHQLDNWSHGDPHTNNVLWDGQHARIIDFETQHCMDLSATQRHADDILVFLLDFMGRAPAEFWLDSCKILLQTYHSPDVLHALMDRLYVPTGLELVLWKTRSNYLSNRNLNDYITRLRQWLKTSVNAG